MPDDKTPLYPLKFAPIYKSKVWGGQALKSLGRSLPADDIGESWEIADLASTSPSGGGGESARSVITNGPLAGQSLNQVITERGSDFLGKLPATEDGCFPLLIKYLDANENLSLQVHPSPQYAAKHDDAFLKSEAWYIVDAQPGAAIYKGIEPGVTPEQFRAAIESNEVAQLEPLLIKVPVKKGDCHYLPSGTCHALGKGILVAEIQTPSDTTFRVFDWGRTDRELHVEQALQCIDFGPAQTAGYEKRSHIAGMFTTVSHLVQCEHFRIEKVRMSEGYQQEIPYDQLVIWMVLEGAGQINPNNGADPVDFVTGETLLLPAGMDDATVELKEDTVWLEFSSPKSIPDQIA